MRFGDLRDVLPPRRRGLLPVVPHGPPFAPPCPDGLGRRRGRTGTRRDRGDTAVRWARDGPLGGAPPQGPGTSEPEDPRSGARARRTPRSARTAVSQGCRTAHFPGPAHSRGTRCARGVGRPTSRNTSPRDPEALLRTWRKVPGRPTPHQARAHPPKAPDTTPSPASNDRPQTPDTMPPADSKHPPRTPNTTPPPGLEPPSPVPGHHSLSARHAAPSIPAERAAGVSGRSTPPGARW